MRDRFWLAGAVLLGLAGCAGSAGGTGGPTLAPAAAGGEPARQALLALDEEGLRAVDAASGSTRLIAFGTPGPQAVEQIGTVLDGPPRDRGINPECGAGPLAFASWGDGLTAWFQDETFAGWALSRGATARSTTMSGIGLGSTRAALEDAYAAEVSDGTLGTEFTAGALSGLLDGPGSDARITDLWAGVSCNFR